MKALAIDFGGTHASLGVVEDQSLLASETIDTDGAKSMAAILPRVAETFRALAKRVSIRPEDCAGISVGIAALADVRIGRVISTNVKYEDSKDVDLDAWSRKSLP